MEAGVREHREDIEEEARAIGGGVTGELAWSCGQLQRRDTNMARSQQTCGGGASPTSVVAEAATSVAVVVAVARPVSVDVGALVTRMMVMVDTSSVIVTSLHMKVARPSHMVTSSTEARLEMRLEMIRGRRGEEAGAHQHPVIGVSLVMEVDISHPLRLLVQVSGQRGWYRGPRGSWELDHPWTWLAWASVTRGQSSRELTSRVSLDGSSVTREEGGLEPIGCGDHAAVRRQTGPMMGAGGAVMTPGRLEEDAGGGAPSSGGRGAGEQSGALAWGKLATRNQVREARARGEELRLEAAVTHAQRELVRHLANGDIRGAQ